MAKNTRKPSKKRFHLMHVYGSTDPAIIGKSHKTYEALLKAARWFVDSSEYTEGEDGLFYIVTRGNGKTEVGSFTNSELEGD